MRQDKKRKRHRKIPLLVGACVWEGNAMGVPPLAFVIRQLFEDKGDPTREASTWLYLESLEREPRPPVWRRKWEVANFDENLPRIYRDSRAMLAERGHWEETAAMVKRALMHRVLQLPQLTAFEVWTNRMEMHGVPCPATEEEATEWRRAQGAQAEGSRA